MLIGKANCVNVKCFVEAVDGSLLAFPQCTRLLQNHGRGCVKRLKRVYTIDGNANC